MIEFEKVICEKIGSSKLREISSGTGYTKDWDLLFQGQHAGIRTVLTDWTAEIASALYFASEESQTSDVENSDGALFCYMLPNNIMKGHSPTPTKSFYSLNPYQIGAITLINPPYFVSDINERIFGYRMFKQKGRFIIPAHDRSNIALNQMEEVATFLLKFKIPADRKSAIRAELKAAGIVREYMYIDEDPVRQELISQINNKIYLGK